MKSEHFAGICLQRDQADDKSRENTEDDLAPGLLWNIAGRNRLCLPGTIGGGEAKTGRKGAFALHDAARSRVAPLRTGSR